MANLWVHFGIDPMVVVTPPPKSADDGLTPGTVTAVMS
jgi:hypothetical protein